MIIKVLLPYVFKSEFLYQTFATLCTYLLLKIVIFYKNRHKRHQLFKHYGIPGPEPNLTDGNLDLYLPNLDRLGKVNEELVKKYGSVFGFFVGDEPSMVITDVDMLKKIFLGECQGFTERYKMFFDTMLCLGIFYAPYNRWKFIRKAISPSFNGYNMRGDASSKFIEDSVNLMIQYIDDKFSEAEKNDTKANIDMHSLMKSTALHLISEMAIKLPNVRVQEDEVNVKTLDKFLATCDRGAIIYAIKFAFLKPIVQIVANYFEYTRILALIHKGLNKVIDETLLKMSTKNYKPTEYPQVIDTLIKLHYEGKLSRREIVGNVESILFAGYDTTSTTLTYIFWVLAKHPDVQEQLRAELMSHGVESKYLVQVINETMRLYPTVISFTTRIATQTVKVNDWIIPKGVTVVYNAWLMHRDPKLWPNPEQFDTSRFSDDAEIHPCAFAPFGLGERRCLGYQLAMMEMKMICCDILVRYRLKLQAPQNLELVTYAGVLSKPKEKVMLELERL